MRMIGVTPAFLLVAPVSAHAESCSLQQLNVKPTDKVRLRARDRDANADWAFKEGYKQSAVVDKGKVEQENPPAALKSSYRTVWGRRLAWAGKDDPKISKAVAIFTRNGEEVTCTAEFKAGTKNREEGFKFRNASCDRVSGTRVDCSWDYSSGKSRWNVSFSFE